MHLAGHFARAVYQPFYQRHRNDFGDPLPEPDHVVETFRIAGLLHDIGHGPFTHLADEVYLYPQFGVTHETIAAQIIQTELADEIRAIRRSPQGAFDDRLDPQIIARLITRGGEVELPHVWRALCQIMRGAYDADIVDFLVRDSLLCGMPGFSLADGHRLMETSLLHEGAFCLHESSLPVLSLLLRHRLHMFDVVYYHRTARAFELSIRQPLAELMRRLLPDNPTHNLEAYYRLDEFQFLSGVFELARTEPDGPAAEMARALERHLTWKEVFYAGRYDERAAASYLFDLPRTSEEIEWLIGRQLAAQGTPVNNTNHAVFLVDLPTVTNPAVIYAGGSPFDPPPLMLYRPPGRLIPTAQLLTREVPFGRRALRVYVRDTVAEPVRHQIREAIEGPRSAPSDHGQLTNY